MEGSPKIFIFVSYPLFMSGRRGMDSRTVAYVGVFAALYTVVGLVPAFPIIGSSHTMSLSEILKPFNGIFLNPFLGTLATGIGAFVLSLVYPSLPFGFAYFLVPAVGTLQAGLLAYKGWKEGSLLLSVLICFWYLFDTGRIVWYYPYLHVAAVVLILATGRMLPNLLRSRYAALSLFIISFCATLTTHLLGSLFFLAMYTPAPSVFEKVIFVYPGERIIFAALSTLLCYAVLKGGYIDRDRWKLL
jgi:uncharacterized membrane protein